MKACHGINISHSLKVSKAIGILYRLKSIYPHTSRVLLILYNTLILPHYNYCILSWGSTLTLYDPWGGGGALKAPTPIFCSHAFNFGAALLCVSDFSQKIV